MRVALTMSTAWPEVRRGGERYLHELAHHLQGRGHEVRIVTTVAGRRPKRWQELGVPVLGLPRGLLGPAGKPKVRALGFGALATAVLAPWRPDVWHAHTTGDGAAAATASGVLRCRSVFSDHGYANPATRWRLWDAPLHRRVVERIGSYLTQTDEAAAMLLAGFGRRAGVRSGGVDVSRHPSAARTTVPQVLFASDASEPRKHLPRLLGAVDLLLQQGHDLTLVLAGPGDQAAALAATTERVRGATRALGPRTPDELATLYAESWATVLASDAEVFGLVLVESLASGTPVVAADRHGPAEIVRGHGGEGRIGVCAEPTVEGLAGAIAEVLDLARDPATAAACRTYAEAWDWAGVIAPEVEALYEATPRGRVRHDGVALRAAAAVA